MSKCDFNKVALQLIEITLQRGFSPVNLVHIFRAPLTKKTSEWLRLIPLTSFAKIFNLDF